MRSLHVATPWRVVRPDAAALIRTERASLVGTVIATAVATLCEAGFLVLVTRAGISLANASREIVLFDDRSVDILEAVALAVGLVTVRFLASVASSAFSARSVARSTIRLRSEFVTAYLASAWDLKNAMAPGRVQQLLSNYTRTAVNVVSATARGLTALISLLSLFAVAVVIQPAITLLGSALVAILGFAMLPLRRRVQRAAATAANEQVRFGTRVHELESMALEIEVYGVSDAASERVRDDAQSAAVALGRSQFLQLLVPPAYQLIAYGAMLALLTVGASSSFEDVGTIGAVLVLLLRCLGYGQAFQVARTQFTHADVFATMLADEIEGFRTATAHHGTLAGTEPVGVEAQGLRYAYGQESMSGLGSTEEQLRALDEIDFSIPSGSTCAVIGPSGSGKSTLTQILTGLRPSDGALTVDGVRVDDADPGWWSSHIAFVPQESQLLTGTVADNVRFLRPSITDDDIERACRLAGVHDEVMAMGGYDASVGEQGSALSGGQRQRLCIARAFAGSPRLLVLDEATSALDAESERRVLASIDDLGEDTTVIAITHRPALLDISDQVIALEDGKVAYTGSPGGYATSSGGSPC